MPWKTNMSRGHLMGTVEDVHTGYKYDGLTVTLSGPVNRTLKTDGTGFFGAVDLPVGTYTVSFTAPGASVLHPYGHRGGCSGGPACPVSFAPAVGDYLLCLGQWHDPYHLAFHSGPNLPGRAVAKPPQLVCGKAGDRRSKRRLHDVLYVDDPGRLGRESVSPCGGRLADGATARFGILRSAPFFHPVNLAHPVCFNSIHVGEEKGQDEQGFTGGNGSVQRLFGRGCDDGFWG